MSFWDFFKGVFSYKFGKVTAYGGCVMYGLMFFFMLYQELSPDGEVKGAEGE